MSGSTPGRDAELLRRDVLDELRYPAYKQHYQQTYPGADCIEESLANAHVARSKRCQRLLDECCPDDVEIPSPAWRGVTSELVSGHPGRYRRFGRFTPDENFRAGCKDLSAKLIDGVSPTHDAGFIGHRLPLDHEPNIDTTSPLVSRFTSCPSGRH